VFGDILRTSRKYTRYSSINPSSLIADPESLILESFIHESFIYESFIYESFIYESLILKSSLSCRQS